MLSIEMQKALAMEAGFEGCKFLLDAAKSKPRLHFVVDAAMPCRQWRSRRRILTLIQRALANQVTGLLGRSKAGIQSISFSQVQIQPASSYQFNWQWFLMLPKIRLSAALPGHPVCRQSFLKLLGVSASRLVRTRKTFKGVDFRTLSFSSALLFLNPCVKKGNNKKW